MIITSTFTKTLYKNKNCEFEFQYTRKTDSKVAKKLDFAKVTKSTIEFDFAKSQTNRRIELRTKFRIRFDSFEQKIEIGSRILVLEIGSIRQDFRTESNLEPSIRFDKFVKIYYFSIYSIFLFLFLQLDFNYICIIFLYYLTIYDTIYLLQYLRQYLLQYLRQYLDVMVQLCSTIRVGLPTLVACLTWQPKTRNV